MKRKPYDPLSFVPPPNVARELLAEAQARAHRLEILAALSEQLHREGSEAGRNDDPVREGPSCLA
jgi:hypothetical protein